MLRASVIITGLLALAAPVHAQDQIAVSVVGKSPRVVHADLYRAAFTVCRSTAYPLDVDLSSCLNASLDDAMVQYNHFRHQQAETITTSSAR